MDIFIRRVNNGIYKGGIALGEQLVGKKFNKSTYLVKLTNGDLDKLNGLSVWCVDVDVSFGDGSFIAP